MWSLTEYSLNQLDKHNDRLNSLGPANEEWGEEIVIQIYKR
jgi:hypothetical protein